MIENRTDGQNAETSVGEVFEFSQYTSVVIGEKKALDAVNEAFEKYCKRLQRNGLTERNLAKFEAMQELVEIITCDVAVPFANECREVRKKFELICGGNK